jgi:hypothetical protein
VGHFPVEGAAPGTAARRRSRNRQGRLSYTASTIVNRNLLKEVTELLVNSFSILYICRSKKLNGEELCYDDPFSLSRWVWD